MNSKVLFCLELEISITAGTIEFSILRKLHTGRGMV